jgi:hypothetical protein
MTAARERRVPDVTLERFRLRELPPEEMESIAQQLRTDPELRDRFESLAASDQAIAADHFPARLAEQVLQRRSAARRTAATTLPLRGLVLASALGAGLIAVAIAQPWSSPHAPAAGGDTIKGLEPSLAIYRRTPNGSETLADGASAHGGDLLRVGYVSAGQRYGVILSIDGRGVVTLHLPTTGGVAASLRVGEVVLLDQAYELDDAPAWEGFYFVTADQPFAVEPIRDAARRAVEHSLRSPPQSLPLPAGFTQARFSIQKEVRP